MNRNVSEPIRNQVFNPDQSESIRSRIDPNQIFNQNQSESFRPWIHSNWLWLKIRCGLIRDRIESDWSGLKTWFRIKSDWFLYKILRILRVFSKYFIIITFLNVASYQRKLLYCIPIHSDICIRANANNSEPIRKTFCISFDEKRLKINPINSKTSIRMYPT